MQNLDLGTASIDVQRPVVAGSHQTIAFNYTAGHPVDDSGYLKIAFRFAGDFGVPQFEDPAAVNYCTVSTTGDCRLQPRWDPKGHTRPWGRALYIKVLGGFLNTGEQIRVVFGDASGGSPGWQVQTFCESTFEFKTLVDPIATYEFKELPSSPVMEIIAGEPVRAVCIAPSIVQVAQPFTYHTKLEDRWGNPVAPARGIEHPGLDEAGIQFLTETDPASGLAAASNPVRVVASLPELRPFWGDLHGQSEETIGSNSIDDYYRFGRDYARLDVASHQGNDFQVTDELWDTVNEAAERYNQPGAFVPFPGYEWSGNTPLGGDRNIYFAGLGGRIVHSCTDLLPGRDSIYHTAQTAAELFDTLAEQEGPRPFAYAHVGGRYADLRMHDEAIELAVEVHSAWGTFEWLVEEALRLGYRIGICANSDGHKGRPGASYPGARKFGSFGGLTCFLAKELTREAILEALLQRHFYATTGNRCLVDVVLESEEGTLAMMGDIVSARSGGLSLSISIAGTAAIESVEVRNGSEVVETLRPYGEEHLSNRVKVVWRGAEVKGRERQSVWDGRLSVLGNEILDVAAINFWNPESQPEWQGGRVVDFRSITTGGVSGLLLTLAEPSEGRLTLDTVQGKVAHPVDSIGLESLVRDCGGQEKQIEVFRLPERGPTEFAFTIRLENLHPGDNPITIRVTQEDGHMAWTSPIYITMP